MGYTHYFTKSDIQPEEIKSIKTVFRLTLSETIRKGIKLVIEDVPEISFNGIEEEGHEQFIFNVKSGFSYCKTNARPYDLAVMVCLIIAKEWLKERIEICSDGKSEDWQPARDICQKVLGYGNNFELDA